MIITTNINEARKQADKLKKEGKSVIILLQDEEFNRKCLEIKGLSMIIVNESLNQKDYMKQRNSQINEVIAKICAEKNIAIGVQINEIIKKNDVEKAKSLARLKQNIMLCRKSGAVLKAVGDLRDKKSAQSLLLSLQASTKQASDAVI